MKMISHSRSLVVLNVGDIIVAVDNYVHTYATDIRDTVRGRDLMAIDYPICYATLYFADLLKIRIDKATACIESVKIDDNVI